MMSRTSRCCFASNSGMICADRLLSWIEEQSMSKYALYVPLKAKPGKEKDVADFLLSAVPLVKAEHGFLLICYF